MINVIVLSAMHGRRLKIRGPLHNIKIGTTTTLFEYQVQTIKEVFPDSHFHLVYGFGGRGSKFADVNIHNEDYLTTNVCGSLSRALSEINPLATSTMIIHGDCYFNEYAIPTEINSISVADNMKPKPEEVGVLSDPTGHFVEQFMYDNSDVWSKLIHLDMDTTWWLKQELENEENQSFEIFCTPEVASLVENIGFSYFEGQPFGVVLYEKILNSNN